MSVLTVIVQIMYNTCGKFKSFEIKLRLSKLFEIKLRLSKLFEIL